MLVVVLLLTKYGKGFVANVSVLLGIAAGTVLAAMLGKMDFAKVAASFSDAPDALTGGVMGMRPLDRLPALYADAAKKLKPGQLSEILRSPAGFHIVKLLDMHGSTQAKAPVALRQTRARHILIKVNELVSETEARRKLVVIKERLDNGADFAELARKHSACPSKEQGGNLGQIGPGQTVAEFEQALFALSEGEVCSEPVKTRFGVHVIRAGRRLEPRQLPFEMVQQRIADYLEEASWRRAIAQYVAILAGQGEISGVALGDAQGALVQ